MGHHFDPKKVPQERMEQNGSKWNITNSLAADEKYFPFSGPFLSLSIADESLLIAVRRPSTGKD